MLRLGLLENVRRMALRTVQRLDEIESADRWAARIVDGRRGVAVAVAGGALSEFIAVHPPLTPAFVSRFLRQLRLAGAAFPPLAWLEQWIAEEGAERRGRGGALDAAARAHAGGDGEQHHQPARHRPHGLEGLRGAAERIEAALRDDPARLLPHA